MVTYQLQVAWLAPTMAGLVIGALFILPFLLFSATSGPARRQVRQGGADPLREEPRDRHHGARGLGLRARPTCAVLLACVFLMGLHSTLFGPVKFAYLPQHLSERELTGGNGMVEMGTFVAILLGNVAGGAADRDAARWAATYGGGRVRGARACSAARSRRRCRRRRPPTRACAINWNPVTETLRNLKLAHGNLVVFRSLLGISWMWFFGAVFLSQFPSFAKEVLHGDEQVASLLLVVFSVGIGIGSLLCEVLSRAATSRSASCRSAPSA